ncbi:MAG: RNA polymerase sigma factor [Acidobacteriota bacterium]|jgi:RNA polymerase sigma-70 factor (ECF subfamily)
MSLPDPSAPGPGRGSSARLSDEELAAAAVDGDRGAFAELFHRYSARVRQFVAWQAGGRTERTEDLVQEIFLQVYRSLHRFAGRSRFRTWLYGTARNVCLHERRRRRRRPEPIGQEGDDRPLDAIPDLSPGIAERLAAGELRRAVRREVERLPEIHRTVLVLRDWEELAYAEIAEVLEVPVGTVRSRLHQARARLATALRDLMEEGR